MEANVNITWEKSTEAKFNQILSGIPDMIRGIAETRVSKRAQQIVRDAGRTEINEKDMVDAFFTETPFGFHGPMKNDMTKLGIDYTKYGHPK